MDGSTIDVSPRAVEGGNGVAWWSEAWALFMRTPLLWIVLAILLFIIMVVLGFIPLVGALAAVLLLPVFVGGWMLAARKVEQGGALEVGDLFTCFQGERLTPLLVVGALLLAGTVVIGLVVGALGLGAVFGGVVGAVNHSSGGVLAALGASLFAGLVAVVLGLLLTMVSWFAPGLVVFRAVPPVEALKISFAACLKNIVPFLVWGVIYLIAAFVASIPLGLGWILLGPLTILAAYASYKDVFGTPA
ncbi:MAG: hypothetical protein KIT17_24730 [Rubrivivax sp.]|nr:hypothetical protein [Rubrivivax sp.]